MNLLLNPTQNRKQPSVCQLCTISRYSISPLSDSDWVNCLLPLPLLPPFLVFTSQSPELVLYDCFQGSQVSYSLNSGSNFHCSSSRCHGCIRCCCLASFWPHPPLGSCGCVLVCAYMFVCVCVFAYMYVGRCVPSHLFNYFSSVSCAASFASNPFFYLSFKFLFPFYNILNVFCFSLDHTSLPREVRDHLAQPCHPSQPLCLPTPWPVVTPTGGLRKKYLGRHLLW